MQKLIERAEAVLSRIEAILPDKMPETDWSALAWRWAKQENGKGYLKPIHQPDRINLSDLHGINLQKDTIEQNTKQFVAGFPANHVLLTGARGTGKSSVVKALLNAFSVQGLRLIEVDKADLLDLQRIVPLLQARSERFIVYCDDLSFESNEMAYKALKVVLDGSVESTSDNVLVYATSNRRHLMPERQVDNEPIVGADEEVRPNETIDEKVALSERFGVHLIFYACDQETYLQIVEHWLKHYGIQLVDSSIKKAALQWSYQRGARSGRVAHQFVKDYAGKMQYAASQQ